MQAELGEIIARDFADKRPLLAPILKGGEWCVVGVMGRRRRRRGVAAAA